MGELLEVLANTTLLLRSLAEEPLLDHEGYVFAYDAELLETGLHPPKALGRELKGRVVEERLLHASHEAEAQVLAHLTHLAKEAEVAHEIDVLATAQVVQDLVDDEEEALVRMDLVEGLHHADELRLVLGDAVGRLELELYPHLGQPSFQALAEDVPQAHLDGTDLHPDYLELARNLAGSLHDTGVREVTGQGASLCHCRDHGHQVGLTRAVVADDQQRLVVDGAGELQLGEDQGCEQVRHPLGHDIRVNQAPCSALDP